MKKVLCLLLIAMFLASPCFAEDEQPSYKVFDKCGYEYPILLKDRIELGKTLNAIGSSGSELFYFFIEMDLYKDKQVLLNLSQQLQACYMKISSLEKIITVESTHETDKVNIAALRLIEYYRKEAFQEVDSFLSTTSNLIEQLERFYKDKPETKKITQKLSGILKDVKGVKESLDSLGNILNNKIQNAKNKGAV